MNMNLLKSKMALYGDTQESLAEHLNLTRQALSPKINGEAKFWDEEIKKIVKRYNLSPQETFDIFEFWSDANER